MVILSTHPTHLIIPTPQSIILQLQYNMEQQSSFSRTSTDPRSIEYLTEDMQKQYPYNCFGQAYFSDMQDDQYQNSSVCVLIGSRHVLTTFHSIFTESRGKIQINCPTHCIIAGQKIRILKWRGRQSYLRNLQKQIELQKAIQKESEDGWSYRELTKKIGGVYRQNIKRDYVLLYLSQPVVFPDSDVKKSRYIELRPRDQAKVSLLIIAPKEIQLEKQNSWDECMQQERCMQQEKYTLQTKQKSQNAADKEQGSKKYVLTKQTCELIQSHLADNWKGMSGAGIVTLNERGNYELLYLHKADFITGGIVVPITKKVIKNINRWIAQLEKQQSPQHPFFFTEFCKKIQEENTGQIEEEEDDEEEEEDASMSQQELRIINLNLSSGVVNQFGNYGNKPKMTEQQVRRIMEEEQAKRQRAARRRKQIQHVQKQKQRAFRQGPPPISQAYKDIQRGVKIFLRSLRVGHPQQPQSLILFSVSLMVVLAFFMGLSGA